MDMNRLMGHVTLNEIKDAICNEANKKDDEIMSFQELSNAIRELHSRKLGDDCTPKLLMDSYATTVDNLSKLNHLNFSKAEQHFLESMINLYNTIIYTVILLTLKKTNNPELIQNAERDFKPLIKKHWDRFTHLTSEFV